MIALVAALQLGAASGHPDHAGTPPPPAQQCPGTVSQCFWSGKVGLNQVSNFSCGSSGLDLCAARCCEACTASEACASWTTYSTGGKATFKANHCFITTNHATPLGPNSTTGLPDCRSGLRPPAPTPRPVPAPPGAKNVLFMVVDDMRAENSAFGQPWMITPNLDKLAKEGIVFNNAYVQMPWCSPSRNSFMTGRYPDTLQIWNFGKSFRNTRENPPTGGGDPDMTVIPMPQYFKEHGYLSLGGGKIYHPNTPPNDDEPYSWSQDIPYFPLVHQTCPAPFSPSQPGCGGCPQQLPDEEFFDWQLANHTIHLMRYAKTTSKPFFIGAGFRRPHTPWFINQRFVNMYSAPNMSIAPPKNPLWAKDKPQCAFICGGDGVGCDFTVDQPRPTNETVLCRRTYYAAVTETDYYVGLVLDELDRLDLTQNTTVLIFGDHGWQLGEGDQWAKYTLSEYATRTPFILRAPWLVTPGSRSTSLVELCDVFPTLAEVSGLPMPPGIQGSSLVPVLRDPTATVRATASSQFAHCCFQGTHTINASSVCEMCGSVPSANISYMGYTVRTADWRWVSFHLWDGASLRPQCDELATELYPHTGDTGASFDSGFETVNVVDQNPDVAAQMRPLLRGRFPKAFRHCASVAVL
mmetsp:Transcript_5125/g.15625  ORF Transcript_5125/g.15625 Transcript_5125/m.15625 type:complete len:636 (-) Transcript_5125:95-2002(-)